MIDFSDIERDVRVYSIYYTDPSSGEEFYSDVGGRWFKKVGTHWVEQEEEG